MSKRAKSSSKPNNVFYAKDLTDEVIRNIFFSDVDKGKEHSNKLIHIQPEENSKERVTIVIDEPGYVPKGWGVETNKYNTTYLQFSVPNEEEAAGLRRLDDYIVSRAESDDWWPERPMKNGKRAPGRETLEDNYTPILKAAKEKPDGGYYAPNIKATIPMGKDGEVQKRVKVLDVNGERISIHSLPGHRPVRVVIELKFVYFQNGSSFGVSKSVRYVRLNETVTDGDDDDDDIFNNLGYDGEGDDDDDEKVDDEKVVNDVPPPDPDSDLMALLGDEVGEKRGQA